MHLFFTIKNSMVLVILIYRLVVVQLKKREKPKEEYHEIEGSAVPTPADKES
jgi:hypothetical protein